jgi:NADH-quinone oxidoreductase subunit N
MGNVIAIAQQNEKRMLAYSSIAHVGYILMGAWWRAERS